MIKTATQILIDKHTHTRARERVEVPHVERSTKIIQTHPHTRALAASGIRDRLLFFVSLRKIVCPSPSANTHSSKHAADPVVYTASAAAAPRPDRLFIWRGYASRDSSKNDGTTQSDQNNEPATILTLSRVFGTGKLLAPSLALSRQLNLPFFISNCCEFVFRRSEKGNLKNIKS